MLRNLHGDTQELARDALLNEVLSLNAQESSQAKKGDKVLKHPQ